MAYFDQNLIGVTEVKARVTGHGGVANVECTESGDTFATNWRFFLTFDFGGAAFVTNANEPFDLEQELPLGEGFDWQNLQRGYAFIMVDFFANITADERRLGCIADYFLAADPAIIESLTITITCDSVVATEGSTWGAMKALFR